MKITPGCVQLLQPKALLCGMSTQDFQQIRRNDWSDDRCDRFSFQNVSAIDIIDHNHTKCLDRVFREFVIWQNYQMWTVVLLLEEFYHENIVISFLLDNLNKWNITNINHHFIKTKCNSQNVD